ncbi:MAG: hypothetical protein PHZ25_00550 [Candidatus Pacebacteria bacterium]|nr:hypothetical protein [Candidatus Paceibacterota bacterium]
MKKIFKTLFLFFPLFFPFLASAEITYEITTPIPGFTLGSSPDLGSFIAAIFQFALAAVGLVAFFMIVYHGINYILGAANESKVGDAKDGLTQVVYGVLLLFGSVIILDTINPCILKSVNFWSSRDTSESCLTSSSSLIGSLNDSSSESSKKFEDTLKEEYSKKENQINITKISAAEGNRLVIIGVNPGRDGVDRITIRKDGTFAADVPETSDSGEASWKSTIAYSDASNINDFGFPYSEAANEQIKTELKNFLIEESKYRMASEYTYDGVGAPLSLPSSDNLTFSFASKDYGSVSAEAKGTCKSVAGGYYRCSMMTIISTTSEGPKVGDAGIFYIEEFPSGRNVSERVIAGVFAEQIKKAGGNI